LIRAAQARDREAETALRRALEIVADTEYHQSKATTALDLAEFLAHSGRTAEARLLCEEYAELTERIGWTAWAPRIVAIRSLIATARL
jgi:hypothetical protein